MKKLSKRLLSIFLALLMMVSALPTGLINLQAATQYIYPIAGNAKVNSGYGIRTINKKTSFHYGVDLDGTTETIVAAASGTVVSISNECDDTGKKCSHWLQYGNHIKIKNDNNTYAVYGHLKKDTLKVKVGDKVVAGQALATIGKSGYSFGVHLHFEIRTRANEQTSCINVNPKFYDSKGIDYKYIKTPVSSASSKSVQKAVDWAVAIAKDDSHGYSQMYRTGPDYDCSSLVGTALYEAGFTGVGTKLKTMSTTVNETTYLEALGFKDVTSSVNLSTGSGLQKGDVLWRSGHTEFYAGNGKMVGARRSYYTCTCGYAFSIYKENCNIGCYKCHREPGDKDGHEIEVSNYTNSKTKPWKKVYRYESYKATAVAASNITNKSVTLGVKLNTKATVQGWGYFLGTNESEVKNVDSNNSNKRKDTKTMDYTMVNWYKPQKQNAQSFSKNITKFLGNDLKSGTKYFYKLFIKIGAYYYTTSVGSFTTKKYTPSITTAYTDSRYKDIGIGDSSLIQWSKSNNAESYNIEVYNSNGTKVYSKNGIKETTAGIPADNISTPDTYSVKLYAVNSVKTVECKSEATIVVHDDVTVTFVNYAEGEEQEIIEKRTVHYGHSVDAPVNPSRVGFTFKGWDKNTDSVTESGEIKTVYTRNKYSVTFINGLTGAVIGKAQNVEYKKSAVAPEAPEMDGYNFAGWDKSYDCITENTEIKANYEWYDNAYPVRANVTGITKKTKSSNNITGYEVSINVINNNVDDTEGRFVVALKSENDVLLAETESSAFSLNQNESKSITVFVPYSALAYKASVYCINNYGHTGSLCESFDVKIDNSNNWSDWYKYTGELPVEAGKNDVIAVDKKTVTDTETQYRYRDKITTTSYNTSLSGYTQNGGSWVSQGQSTLDYVSNGFNSGFDKNNALYKKYNNTKKTNSENTTTKVTVNSDAFKTYIYWHWCRGASVGAINRGIEWSKTGSYTTFHAFESTSKKEYKGTGYNAYQFQNASKCNDTYWWFGNKSNTDSITTIRTQKYTTYKKLFNYYKWSDWSTWSTTPQQKSATKEVETKQVETNATNYYRYKTSQPVENPTVSSDRIVDIEGKVDKEFAGKPANVYVYKYTQTADYTNEYISNTVTVGEDGTISIPNAVLREAPTFVSGDYTIVAAVKGCTEAIEIGKIEAPKPVYTVKFYDYNRKDVISSVQVEAGSTAIAPLVENLNIEEGYKFISWDQSVVNVNDNLNVYPVCEKETYVVTFIDWNSQKAIMEERQYGDEVNPPSVEEVEGIVSNWDLSSAKKIQVENEDGTVEDKYIIVENTIIQTSVDYEHYKSIFLKDIAPNTNVDDIDITEQDIEEYDDTIIGENVDPLSDYEDDDYIFYGWRSVSTGEYLQDTAVSESDVYYPVYEFAETAVAPVADVITGEFDEEITVTLSSPTENSVIYYTTDNSDPAKSETAKEYTEPITLNKSCVLKFVAMAFGMNNSPISMETYAINTSSSGTRYHLVTVYNDIPEIDGYYYQALIREGRMLNTSSFENLKGGTLDGYYLDEEHTDEFMIDDEAIIEETTIYAHYILDKYNAVFLDDDGTVLKTEQVEYMGSAVAPTPTKDGYVFLGWDSNEYTEMKADGTFTAKYCPEDEYATVSLNRTKVSTYVGKTYSGLRAATLNLAGDAVDTELEWSSSDGSIATVDEDGKVTCLSDGTVTIKATVLSTGKSAECEFTIKHSTDTRIITSSSFVKEIADSDIIRCVVDGTITVNDIEEEFLNTNLTFFNQYGDKADSSETIATGSSVAILDDESEIEGAKIDERIFVIVGEINSDGFVNNRDVALLNQSLIEKKELELCESLAADVNGDGYVNNRDAAMLARYLVGKETLK